LGIRKLRVSHGDHLARAVADLDDQVRFASMPFAPHHSDDLS
jgi:hypothetical protein